MAAVAAGREAASAGLAHRDLSGPEWHGTLRRGVLARKPEDLPRQPLQQRADGRAGQRTGRQLDGDSGAPQSPRRRTRTNAGAAGGIARMMRSVLCVLAL